MPPSQPIGYLPREMGAYLCFTTLAHLSAPFHEALHPVPWSHIHLQTPVSGLTLFYMHAAHYTH